MSKRSTSQYYGVTPDDPIRVNGPFGEKKILYADWVASGRLYKPIEELLQNKR